MIGILGGMGTQAGLDFCSKLAKLNRGKTDQNYPLFLLYNKSNIPNRKQNLKKYNKVLKSLLDGCKFLERNNVKTEVEKIADSYFLSAFNSLKNLEIDEKNDLYGFFKMIQERSY